MHLHHLENVSYLCVITLYNNQVVPRNNSTIIMFCLCLCLIVKL